MDLSQLIATFRKIILANELDNNSAYAHKFSDPDGVRSGKSGWSFGISQFDLLNNPTAAACLRACGFTEPEIHRLKAQTIDARALEPKLKAAAATIELFDQAQLKGCITRAQRILSKRSCTPANDAALLAVADYANQYHLSDINKPGYLVHYLAKLARPFTAADVLQFKLVATRYGREHRGDCQRRYDNLIKIMEAA
jgi:hypothetical protein